MTTSTELSRPRFGPKKSLKVLLEDAGYRKRLNDILGARAPQFGAALMQVVAANYRLQKCDPTSVIGAAVTAACLDLSLDPNLGEAHLVPYGDRCQFQLGYKGFVQLGLRSAQYRRLGWKIIYDGELVDWNPLTGELVLKPAPRNNSIIGFAAYFMLVNGFERASYWTMPDVVEHAMRYSQAYKAKKQDSLWYTNFNAMALKTVLKELINKWGPKSVLMQQALARDQQVFSDLSKGDYGDAKEAKDEVPFWDEDNGSSGEKGKDVEQNQGGQPPMDAQPEPPVTEEPPPAKPELTKEQIMEEEERKAEQQAKKKAKLLKDLLKLTRHSEPELMQFLAQVWGIDDSIGTLATMAVVARDTLGKVFNEHKEIFAAMDAWKNQPPQK